MQVQTKCGRCLARGKKRGTLMSEVKTTYPHKSLRCSFFTCSGQYPQAIAATKDVQNRQHCQLQDDLVWRQSLLLKIILVFCHSNSLAILRLRLSNVEKPVTLQRARFKYVAEPPYYRCLCDLGYYDIFNILFIALNPASHRNIVVSPKNTNRKKLKYMSFIYSLTQLVLPRSGAG